MPKPRACCGHYVVTNWFSAGEPATDLDIGNRGFQYGDGLFETIAIRSGTPRLWQLHMDRLADGCTRLGLSCPNAGELLADVARLVNGQDAAVAKIVISAEGGNRGYGRKVEHPTSAHIGVFPTHELAPSLYREGIDITICQTRLATGSAVAGLKTLSRIEQVLARSELQGSDWFEGLTRDADGRLICGTMSNMFVVRNNTLCTPSLDRCGVEGVMRRFVLQLLEQAGETVEISDVESLDGCTELFLTNSQFGVLPVRRCDETEWSPGPITKDVMRRLADAGIEECGA